MIHVALFGRFGLTHDGKELSVCNSAKAEELFCFLLLHRDRPHAREKLASILWGDHCTTATARKYLRNSLWRLQTMLDDQQEQTFSEVLEVEPDWIHFKPSSRLSTDVIPFEKAYAAAKGKSGYALTPLEAQGIELAIQQYRGYLLENRYEDWCVFERERLHQIYLVMLDKLMTYCDAHGRYEEGLSYGRRILQYDRAREHSHRHMMLLHMRSGDRTGALRQYTECVTALKEEFDVEPSERTQALYKRIRAARRMRRTNLSKSPEIPREAMSKVLSELHDLRESLSDMQRQLRHVARAAELALVRQPLVSSDPETPQAGRPVSEPPSTDATTGRDEAESSTPTRRDVSRETAPANPHWESTGDGAL